MPAMLSRDGGRFRARLTVRSAAPTLAGMYVATLRLFNRDPLEYRFCSPGWRAAREPAALEGLMEQAAGLDAERCQRLSFSGSVPLEHPDFDRLVEHCRGLGLRHFALETDGASLAEPGVLESLVERGFEQVFVHVPGVRQRVYEKAMHDPGRFRLAMEGLRRAAESPLQLYLVVPVLRWTKDDVVPLIEWALHLPGDVQGMLLALPEVDRVPEAARPLVMSGGELAPLAARAFYISQGNNLEYGFYSKRGISPCAAKGALDRYATTFHDRFGFFRHAAQEEKVERVPACGTCSLTNTCLGMEPAYAAHFGTQELEPVPLDVSMNWKLRRINRLEQRDYNHFSPFRNDSKGPQRTLLRINGHCNMSCSFCFVDRTVPDYETTMLEAEIEQLAAHSTDHLVLSGGEPTLHPDLPRMIRKAKILGFRTIEIQSNGVKAADLAYAKELADAGLNKITVSLHSVNPEKSDEITRLPRAFGKTIQAMQNFRQMGVLTQVAHVITKANYKELPTTVRFLRETFPEKEGHLSICFAIAQGISDLVFSWVIPTFTEIKPYFREALDYALETGVGFGGMIGQGGYPPCMLDGEMKYYQGNLDKVYRSEDHTEQFYKAERCRECSFDPYCIGVRRDYVAHYGEAEIQPFQAEIKGAVAIPQAPPAGPKKLVALNVKTV